MGNKFFAAETQRREAKTVRVFALTLVVLLYFYAPLATANEQLATDTLPSAGKSMDGLMLAANGFERRRPGTRKADEKKTASKQPRNAESHRVLPPPANAPRETVPLPDRWRLVDSLDLVKQRWFDPYNANTLKGDRPVAGDDWFFNLSLISDTVFEPRRLPTPVAPQSSSLAGSVDIFGQGEQSLFNQNLVLGLVYYKGNTTFKPPDYEFRFTPVFNYNRTEADEQRALLIDPADGETRKDNHMGIQELFFDKHLRNVSDRYDFDSLRIGIQPFSNDFRGFLFQDLPAGIRLFGTRNNNIVQYNLGIFRRLEKDTNSGLNDASADLRKDDIFVFNIYWQDFPVLGYTSQWSLVHNRNRENEEFFYDNNGFIARPASLGTERPREYDVSYLGYAGDGHIGRLNVSITAYYAFGEENLAVFTDMESDIDAGFFATELSIDSDWKRWRLSALYASGDSNPYDNKSNGFDAIAENPLFAGADTSFWIRQGVPNIGGGGVALSTRNGILNNLRSSKEHGQSNFTNPGTLLLGIGADFDLTPESRLSFNINQLWFDDTTTLEVARNQANIDKDIGLDISLAYIWRPMMTQNVIVRFSAATLQPGDGYKQMFGDESPYSILANIVFAY
jgi:hypothetical protein